MESIPMFIFLKNAPREYAWGSTQALSDFMGLPSTGKPQAELWFGSHAGDPAELAKASRAPHTLIDLIEADPSHYGVAGGRLPFLMKVLAIGGPLSLQVHPNEAQAAAGFARESELGLAHDDPRRNYGDPRHKPELLVALTEVSALSGFRAMEAARSDLLRLAAAAGVLGDSSGAAALREAAELLDGNPETARQLLLRWALSGTASCVEALRALEGLAVEAGIPELTEPMRAESLRDLIRAYPGDGGVLVSLLLHFVRLQPGEALFLAAQQVHAYLSGVGLEIMAASDNVLRAGLTAKRVDVDELLRVATYEELLNPRFPHRQLAPGVRVWAPPVSDFRLYHVLVFGDSEHEVGGSLGRGEGTVRAVLPADTPLVAVVTRGTVQISRQDGGYGEMASVHRGQCLFISVGNPVEFSGSGEVFVGMTGAE